MRSCQYAPQLGAIVRPMKNPSEWRANVTQIRNRQGLAMDGTDAAQLSAGEIEGEIAAGGAQARGRVSLTGM